MPENNDLFAPFVRDTTGLRFEPSAGVRRRGAVRRRRRRAGVAGLAALVVAGVAVTSAWALSAPTVGPDVAASTSATPTPSATPSATSSAPPGPTPSATPTTPPPRPGAPIPPEAMLQAADLGTGYRISDAQESEDHGSMEMMMSYCGRGDYSPTLDQRLAGRRRAVSRSAEQYVLEEVSRYEQPPVARRHLADLRTVLNACGTVDIMGDPRARVTLTVVATDFTGTGSVLIHESGSGRDQYHAVVQQGEVEARLRIHTGATGSQARAIAVKAAERLCAATPTC